MLVVLLVLGVPGAGASDPDLWVSGTGPGPMHVDVQVTGGSWSTSPGADQYLLTGVAQWDGKAVRG